MFTYAAPTLQTMLGSPVTKTDSCASAKTLSPIGEQKANMLASGQEQPTQGRSAEVKGMG